MRKLTQVQDRTIRAQAVQAINNSPLRQRVFATWVDQVLPKRGAGHSVQTLTLMSEAVAEFSRKKGVEPARVLAMNEKNVAHTGSAKHIEDGVALSIDEMRQLPALLIGAKVYWDRRHNNIVYAIPVEEGKTIVVATEPNRHLKKIKGSLDQIVNAYKISDRRLETDIKRFEEMKP